MERHKAGKKEKEVNLKTFVTGLGVRTKASTLTWWNRISKCLIAHAASSTAVLVFM